MTIERNDFQAQDENFLRFQTRDRDGDSFQLNIYEGELVALIVATDKLFGEDHHEGAQVRVVLTEVEVDELARVAAEIADIIRKRREAEDR